MRHEVETGVILESSRACWLLLGKAEKEKKTEASIGLGALGC